MERFFLEELDLVSNKDKSKNFSQEECIAFSNKLIELFKAKAKQNSDKKITFSQVCDVFCSAVENFDKREDLSKDINEWSLARVNGFLRILKGKSIQFSSKNSRNKKGLDITENWQPSEEDFILAKEDMEKHNLKFSFSSVEDLYIKDGVSKYWFERYL